MPTLVRLQAAAHLYGVAAPPPATASLLALGSGWEPLVTWASVFPGVRLTLLVETERHADEALQLVQSVRCNNVAVRTFSDNLNPDARFDYVLVHGLYSRLPAGPADQLLGLCSAVLDNAGLAYVDYDVRPGGSAMDNVLQLVHLHLHGIEDEQASEEAAEAALRYVQEGSVANDATSPMRAAAARLLGELKNSGVSSLLAARRGACHFLEFVAAAEAAGLGYIGDLHPLRDVPRMYGAAVSVSHSLHTLGKPQLLRQQYLDFATGRSQRAALLMRAGAVSNAAPDLSRLEDFHWAAGYQRLDGSSIARGQAGFVDATGRTLSSPSPVMTAILDVLSWAWPSAVPLEVLQHEVGRAIGQESGAGDLKSRILDVLTNLAFREMVEYSLGPGPYDQKAEHVAVLLPGFAQALAGRDSGCCAPRSNLWGQPMQKNFPPEDFELLSQLEKGFDNEQEKIRDAQVKEHTAVFEEGKLRFQNPVKSRQERVSLLNWHGLILASAGTWHDTVRALLAVSEGTGPYWADYVHALARARILHADVPQKSFSPTPQMQRRLDDLLNRHVRLSQSREVEPLVRQLIQAAPDWLAPMELLARCLVDLGKFEEALEWMFRAFGTQTHDAQTYLVLASVLSARSRLYEAIVAARQTLALEPKKVQAYIALGNALKLARRYNEAEYNYRIVLEHTPEHAGTWVNLVSVLTDMGLTEDAIEAGEEGLRRFPHNAGLRSNYFFALNYSLRSGEAIYEKYCEAEREIYSRYKNSWKVHRNSRNLNRRIRIGYVSPDFRGHAVARFLEPLMAFHDHSRFHITAYADIFKEDSYTERFKSYSDVWRDVTGWTPEAVAERIREDEIDILVDVAGHTGNNRLLTFAQKPAPISLTWLGFGYTTGLKAIDYILMDEEMAPRGSEHLFSETPWRLPGTPFVIRMPRQAKFQLGELPALKNGYVRFGTLTRAIRINPQLVKTWAAILQRVEGSKLVVDSTNFDDPWVARRLHDMFAEHGIGPDRLEIGYHSPPWKLLNGVDIGLDCFPHNSGTTLMEMLYMGLPYVTKRDRPSVGRLGASILKSIGRTEWIADTPEEYVEIAVRLASDLPALAEIRNGLRPAMERSRLMDEEGFAREVEGAYQAMFEKWVAERRSG